MESRMVFRLSVMMTLVFLAACVPDNTLQEDTTVDHMQTSVTTATNSHEAFDTFARQFCLDQVIPSLSIAVARGNEIVFIGNYGFQDHDGEEPTTSETSYLAASISKTFTAATLLAMEADGHISLDEDFTTFSEWGPQMQLACKFRHYIRRGRT